MQPDLCHCGGFTVGKQIAATAATFGIGVCPHNPMGPIAGVVGLHFGAAVPNFVILEEITGSVPWYDEVVQTPIRRVDGHWELPTEPGLGVEVNEKAAAAHPFQQEDESRHGMRPGQAQSRRCLSMSISRIAVFSAATWPRLTRTPRHEI